MVAAPIGAVIYILADAFPRFPRLGTLPDTLEPVSLRPEPDTVPLIVPEGTAGPDHIATEAIDLRQIGRDTAREIPLAVPPDSHLPSSAPSEVTIRVDVHSRQ